LLFRGVRNLDSGLPFVADEPEINLTLLIALVVGSPRQRAFFAVAMTVLIIWLVAEISVTGALRGPPSMINRRK
jgi:hypothetical protein